MIILFIIGAISLIVLANVLAAYPNPTGQRLFTTMLLSLNITLTAVGLALLGWLPPLNPIVVQESGLLSEPARAGWVIVGLGLWGMAMGQTAVRRALSRWLPLNPTSPVHTLALIFSGFLVGSTALTLVQGGLEGLAETAVNLSVADVVMQQLMFVLLALFGVGLLIRRNNDQLNQRLGLVLPTWQHAATGLRWIGLLLLIQWLIGILWLLLNPGQAELLTDLSGVLFGGFDTVWEWFVLALVSGIGEELLFRGALQPIFGLVPTALLFAIAHVQYGFTPATLSIFIIGLALGHLRRTTNTTTTIFVHFGYNFTLGLLSLLLLYLEPLAG